MRAMRSNTSEGRKSIQARISQWCLFRLFDNGEAEEGRVGKRQRQTEWDRRTFKNQRCCLLPSSASSPIAREEPPPSKGTHLPQLAQIHLTFPGMIFNRMPRIERGTHTTLNGCKVDSPPRL